MKKLVIVFYYIGKVIAAFSFLLLMLAIAFSVATSSEYGTRNSPKFDSKEVEVVWQNVDIAECVVTDGYTVYTYETSEPLNIGATLTLTCFDKGVACDIPVEDLTSDVNKMFNLSHVLLNIWLISLLLSLACEIAAVVVAQPKEMVEQN